MSNQVPERLINFNVYNNADRLLGVATVEMPDIEYMTETVSGAGIAGELESSTLGHFAAMSTTVTFRTVTADALALAAPDAHLLTFRGSQQIYDAGAGTYSSQALRVTMKCTPKRVGLGSLEVGSTTDTEVEFSVSYIKVLLGGAELIEIDVLNNKFVINGVDRNASIRSDLGQ